MRHGAVLYIEEIDDKIGEGQNRIGNGTKHEGNPAGRHQVLAVIAAVFLPQLLYLLSYKTASTHGRLIFPTKRLHKRWQEILFALHFSAADIRSHFSSVRLRI